MLTTSRDDTLRVWEGKKDMAQAVSIKHYNNTGRWVSPFRSVWGPAADTVICGSMKRNVSCPPSCPYTLEGKECPYQALEQHGPLVGIVQIWAPVADIVNMHL